MVTPETREDPMAPAVSSEFLRLAAGHYENFPVGSWLVPRLQRRHLHRIYAFARIADDIADEDRDSHALAALRRSLRDHLADASVAGAPLLVELRTTIRELSLPEELFFDLLDAFAEDLERHRHDEASLLDYCRRSADPIGRLVLRVFGHDDPQMDQLSDRICTALQLVNHLQDIKEDLRDRGRIYFPEEDLARHGVTEADLRSDSASPAVRALVSEWADRTREMFREGWPLVGRVRGRLRIELRAILRGAAAVLRHMREADHDVLSTHLRLTRRAKARVMLGALVCSSMPKEFAK